MKKALVLEGGGLRGAYTAGVCAWLIENGVEFDLLCGISSGALFAICTGLKDIDMLHDCATTYSVAKRNFGLQPFLLEGQPVGYDYLFKVVLPIKVNLIPSRIQTIKPLVEFGVYDLKNEDVLWKNQSDLKENLQWLKAACVLPIAGRNVLIDKQYYMDAGVRTMIPLDQTLTHDVDKLMIVTTKADNFVRKDNSPMVQFLLDVLYFKHKKLLKEFRDRKEVYYREMGQVKDLVTQGKAIHMRPTKDSGATRFSATYEQVNDLFEMGKSDCELRKTEIFDFFKA
ncbi:MAG: patatin-like phospholipase [Erysipelotrichaceae bacterium]|nr:MAG: patatin-like [Erysipelotrichaceae bacterium]TXT18499.1 MAG: patatin-like phospholipase [Erysipelotrichaceae bacterium]